MSKQSEANVDDGLILCGYQKKLNTMKKKFFALYQDTCGDGARLEYYGSIKKFKSGTAPKRVVKLENCLNINRRFDTKHDYVIAIATKDGGFDMVLDSEEEMLKWLKALLSLQRSVCNKNDSYLPTFDQVWQVVMQKKTLAEERKLIGNYHVCLSPKCVTFIRIGSEKSSSGVIRATDIQIPLKTIRRCGDSHCLFYMEVGRQCIIGPGELWMETDDPMVAQSMHKMISSAMSVRTDAYGDSTRKRSSSVTETSKSTIAMEMGCINPENKNYNINQSANNNPVARGRCDSFPTRIRENSQHFKSANIVSSSSCSMVHHPLILPRYNMATQISSPFRSAEKRETVKMDEQEESGNYLPLRFKSAENPIPEENSDDLMNSDNASYHKESYISMAPVVYPLDSTENNKSQEGKCIGLGDSVNSQNSIITSDLITKMRSAVLTTDNEFDRMECPKRSYSIGSKFEKSKVKRLGYSNDIAQEATTLRTRAFSVGSRAKIPKSDLQLAVPFPKSRFNQSCISNNSLNLGGEDVGHKWDWNTNCNKKSTSAPLLIQNHQPPVDCMSDLMEIDFSKSSNHKAHKSTAAVNEQNSEIRLNDFNNVPFAAKSQNNFASSIKPLERSEESGYLAMKPVNFSNSCSDVNNENISKIPRANDISVDSRAKSKEFINANQEKSISSDEIIKKQQPIIELVTGGKNDRINETNGGSVERNKHDNSAIHNDNMARLSSLYSNLSLQKSRMTDANSNHPNPLLCYVENKNLPTKQTQHFNDISSSKNICEGHKNNKNEVGVTAAATPLTEELNKSSQPRSLDKNSGSPSTSLPYGIISSGCTSASNTRFTEEEQLITNKENKEKNSSLVDSTINDHKATLINIPITSSPNSANCHELYYAKLDLPQCSTKNNKDIPKSESNLSIKKTENNDSYAKIDFDHSSDSSTSSKIFIN